MLHTITCAIQTHQFTWFQKNKLINLCGTLILSFKLFFMGCLKFVLEKTNLILNHMYQTFLLHVKFVSSPTMIFFWGCIRFFGEKKKFDTNKDNLQ